MMVAPIPLRFFCIIRDSARLVCITSGEEALTTACGFGAAAGAAALGI